MKTIETLTFDAFAAKYCERHVNTPDGLRAIFALQKATYNPKGWLMLRCIVLDSSRLGMFTILPYGGTATLQEIPTEPFSPRGLCSDISEVVAVLPVGAL